MISVKKGREGDGLSAGKWFPLPRSESPKIYLSSKIQVFVSANAKCNITGYKLGIPVTLSAHSFTSSTVASPDINIVGGSDTVLVSAAGSEKLGEYRLYRLLSMS